jgi:hypothetical protein
MHRVAVIYAYFEKNEMYRKNLEFFINCGVNQNNENIDYYFIVNGHTDFTFPTQNNVKVSFRENKGFDFAGYNYGIQESKSSGKEYDYYFFINTSCRGPFLPSYCKNMKWIEPFIQLFDDDKTIKLVGSTINPLTWSFRPHVQSYFFVLNKEGLEYVVEQGLFDKSFDHIHDVVENQELELSLLILRNGWNISCLIPEYQNINYSQCLKDLNERGTYSAVTLNGKTFYCNGTAGDITHPGNKCFGRDIHPYEVIFIKTESGCSIDQIHSITRQHGL